MLCNLEQYLNTFVPKLLKFSGRSISSRDMQFSKAPRVPGITNFFASYVDENGYINEYGNRIESKYYISPALRLDLNATEYELYRGMNKNVLRDSSLVFTVKCKPVSPGEAN